ncbi:hypothetical protein [Streptomyces bullii]|uniref:Uncharacterized protein n=1 Tax=Streptomyces bullii TaxID=349910 RepID=A0ABW0UKZ8_9ACTN
MTDRPYTDDDLRAEAARQHATLTQDPDFMGVGEQMSGRFVRYEVVDPDHGGLMPAPGSPCWDDLDEDQYDQAQRKIHDLINGAVDVSEWAVSLGADGLEPTNHTVTLDNADGPFIRLHMAFHPDMPEHDRARFAMGLMKVIAHNT